MSDSDFGYFSGRGLRMRVKTAHYQRSLTLEAWSKGKHKSLVSIVKPAKDAGTITLKNGDAIYTYLPRTDRTIKLNAGINDVSRLEAIVPTVSKLLALFREKGWPILHTRESHKPDLSDRSHV